MKIKKPFNDKGEAHGYWEKYHFELLIYKGYFINGKMTGYWEYYNYSTAKLAKKEYHIL